MTVNTTCACGLTSKDQHSNRRAGLCDGIEKGKVEVVVSGTKAAFYEKESGKLIVTLPK